MNNNNCEIEALATHCVKQKFANIRISKQKTVNKRRTLKKRKKKSLFLSFNSREQNMLTHTKCHYKFN